MTTPDPPAPTAEKLSGDEYMAVLVQRQAEFMQARQREVQARTSQNGRPPLPLLSPLLEWFIQPGDEHLVDLPQPAPKRKPEPRYYRPSTFWRERITHIEAQMAATAARADLGDPAAARGCALGPKRTARHQKRADAALTRYVALDRKLSHAKGMLCSALARESKAANTTPQPG